MSKQYADTFCVEFDTKEMPGKVVATQVTLKKWIMGDRDVARVNLCEHPLYPKLCEYVFSNPPPGVAEAAERGAVSAHVAGFVAMLIFYFAWIWVYDATSYEGNAGK